MIVRTAILSLALAASVWLAVMSTWFGVAADVSEPRALPEFTHTGTSDWINSGPLARADLAGKVVLIDFWTFGCWNCFKSFPWLKRMEAEFKDHNFLVLGVHTPEFEHEKDYNRILEKVEEFGLDHPIMIDNDFSYWNAMQNRYWPTFYLVDKLGKVRATYVGETRDGDEQARTIEEKIRHLLSEVG